MGWRWGLYSQSSHSSFLPRDLELPSEQQWEHGATEGGEWLCFFCSLGWSSQDPAESQLCSRLTWQSCWLVLAFSLGPLAFRACSETLSHS